MIIDEITAAMSTPLIEVDRDEAIATPLRAARSDDVVVIAGKGHETTQTIGDEVRPFDDVAVAKRYLDARIAAGDAS